MLHWNMIIFIAIVNVIRKYIFHYVLIVWIDVDRGKTLLQSVIPSITHSQSTNKFYFESIECFSYSAKILDTYNKSSKSIFSFERCRYYIYYTYIFYWFFKIIKSVIFTRINIITIEGDTLKKNLHYFLVRNSFILESLKKTYFFYFIQKTLFFLFRAMFSVLLYFLSNKKNMF